MFWPLLVSAGLGFVHATLPIPRGDIEISQSVRDPTFAKDFSLPDGLTIVDAGVTYWLSGGAKHNILGNVNNSGTIMISQTDYIKQNQYAGGMSDVFVGVNTLNGNLNNRATGFISVNDYGAYTSSSYVWNLNGMENDGTIQFCARGDKGGSTYQMICQADCYNYGLIDYEQYFGNQGTAFFWRSAPLGRTLVSPNIYNEGAFRLANVFFFALQNVLGSGCWVVDAGAILYLDDGAGINQNPNYGPTFPNQKIYFSSSQSGTLHLHPAVYAQNANFGPQIYGFGVNHAIEFVELIKSFSYQNGVLSVSFTSQTTVNIKIGTGYVASGFYVGLNPQFYSGAGYNAIFYRGSTPSQALPGVCQVSTGKCANPEQTASSPGMTSTTTSSSNTATTTVTTAPTTTASPITTASTATTSSTNGPGPRAGGAGPKSTYIASNGDVYGICPNTDFQGGDLTNTGGISSDNACADACSRTPGCVSASLLRGASICYLKNVQGPAIANTGVDGVYKISSGSVISTSSTSTTVSPTTSSLVTTTSAGAGPCAVGASPQSTYVASNGDVYGVCPNTDFPGGDSTSVGGISSVNACADACSRTTGCVSASLLRGASTCYLKSVQKPATANTGVDSVFKISSGSPISSSAPSSTTTVSRTTLNTITTSSPIGGSGPCAGGVGPRTTYTTSNGDVYGVCANTDFPGGDSINLGGISSVSACADACSSTFGCVAASLLRGSATCYLKSVQGPAASNSGVDSVYKISSGSSGPSITSTTAANPSISTTIMKTPTTSNSVTASSTTLSTATIASTTSSTATTTSPGIGSGPCAGGAGPQSTYVASNGDVYGVCPNTDLPGGDLKKVKGSTSWSACAYQCSCNPKCVAASWNQSASVCYLKNVQKPGCADNNSESVYKISSYGSHK